MLSTRDAGGGKAKQRFFKIKYSARSFQVDRFSKGLGFEEMVDYKPSEDQYMGKNVCSQCLYCGLSQDPLAR